MNPEKLPLEEKDRFIKVLHLMAPGTKLREGIAYILQSDTGGLLVLSDSRKVRALTQGGFEIDIPYSPTHLHELSKMDGAIILNEDATRIISANIFLTPSNEIPSDETGTRHRAADRLAKQTNVPIIAISERRGTVTLYIGDRKHIMDSIATILNKANQAMQTFDKYSVVLHEALQDLSMKEFQDVVTIYDVCKVVQRVEILQRIAEEIRLYIIELGQEGRLIELQLNELLSGAEEGSGVVEDYYNEDGVDSSEKIFERLSELSNRDLLNLNNICAALGYGTNIRNVDSYLTPRGYRILNQTGRLSQSVIDHVVEKFVNLQSILRASHEELMAVEGIGEVMATRIKEGLDSLKNQLVFASK